MRTLARRRAKARTLKNVVKWKMNPRRVSGSAGLPRSSAPALHSRAIPYSRPGVSGSGSSLVPPNNELELVLRELREMKKGQQEINARINYQ